MAVGLLREVSKTSIEFATEPSELRFLPETLDATLDLISHPDRRVPVPRRIIRLIASGARRTLIATILGHLIRCLFYKHGECHPKGCCKASWIAEVFGVSERCRQEAAKAPRRAWLASPAKDLPAHTQHPWRLARHQSRMEWPDQAKETLGVQAADEPHPGIGGGGARAPTEAQAAPEPPPPPANNPAAKQPPLPAPSSQQNDHPPYRGKQRTSSERRI